MHKHAFFSELSREWDERHAGEDELERLQRFADHFRLGPGERVLDAGCGSGRLIPVVCERIGPGGSLVELDFAHGMLEIARSKPHGAHVTFMLGDAQAIPAPDGDFDKVIALGLLPHLNDKAAALREFHRVLKAGGLLVIAHQMGRKALDLLHGRCSEPIRHDLLPEKEELQAMLATAGFSAIEILDDPERFVAWGQA